MNTHSGKDEMGKWREISKGGMKAMQKEGFQDGS
jgi:hypothetical protein